MNTVPTLVEAAEAGLEACQEARDLAGDKAEATNTNRNSRCE